MRSSMDQQMTFEARVAGIAAALAEEGLRPPVSAEWIAQCEAAGLVVDLATGQVAGREDERYWPTLLAGVAMANQVNGEEDAQIARVESPADLSV